MYSVVCVSVLVLVAFLIVAAQQLLPNRNTKASSCNVTGQWHSELGSLLWLTTVGPEVRGVYQTAVESALGAAGHNHQAKIVGVVGEGRQPTIAFSVLWIKGSCSAWVGQCFVLPGGSQVLKTLWMLRSVAETSLDNWDSTRLGEDQFIFVGDVENASGH
ncbi:avidin [Electrophorus electricus]|uniref:avidin n=1 Tax=Electrophorus electricus TaxID=8005 RepID=UPI0015D04A10|nr:avidin [Electrophorus electricus]